MEKRNTADPAEPQAAKGPAGPDAERKLKDSESRYQTLVENIPAGVLIYGRDGRIRSYNAIFQKMTGYTRTDIAEMEPDEFFESRDGWQALSRELGSRGVLRNYLANLKRKNGRPFHALVTIIPQSEDDSFLAVIEDITEHRRIEEALAESERRFGEIIATLPDATFAIDTEGRIILWNRAMEEFSGIKAVDILGKGDLEYSIPFYGKRQPLLADLVLKPDRNAEKRYSFIAREIDRLIAEPIEPVVMQGKKMYLWVKASPMYDLDGNITGVIQSVRDVTAQKKAERRLIESEERYRTAIEFSNDGVAIVQGKTHLFVNRRFCEIFGFDSPEEIIGKTHYETVHPDDIDKVREMNVRRQRGESVPDKYVFRGRRKDGALLYIEVSATATRYRNKQVTLAYLRDVTDWKLASDALKDSETKFRAIFENANDGIFLVDGDTIADCNRNAASMFGCGKADIIGKSPYALSPPQQPGGQDSKKEALQRITEALSGTPQIFRWTHRRCDGTDFETEVSLNSIDLTGKIYVQAVVRDLRRDGRSDDDRSSR